MQCESYLRLCKEIANQEETGTQHVDLESLPEVDEDKTFAAMGVSKTISTVRLSDVYLIIAPMNFEHLTGHLLHREFPGNSRPSPRSCHTCHHVHSSK